MLFKKVAILVIRIIATNSHLPNREMVSWTKRLQSSMTETSPRTTATSGEPSFLHLSATTWRRSSLRATRVKYAPLRAYSYARCYTIKSTSRCFVFTNNKIMEISNFIELTSPIPEEDPVMMTTFPSTFSDSLHLLMNPRSLKNIENGMNTKRNETVTIGRRMLKILLIKAISLPWLCDSPSPEAILQFIIFCVFVYLDVTVIELVF